MTRSGARAPRVAGPERRWARRWALPQHRARGPSTIAVGVARQTLFLGLPAPPRALMDGPRTEVSVAGLEAIGWGPSPHGGRLQEAGLRLGGQAPTLVAALNAPLPFQVGECLAETVVVDAQQLAQVLPH